MVTVYFHYQRDKSESTHRTYEPINGYWGAAPIVAGPSFPGILNGEKGFL